MIDEAVVAYLVDVSGNYASRFLVGEPDSDRAKGLIQPLLKIGEKIVAVYPVTKGSLNGKVLRFGEIIPDRRVRADMLG
jgi:hypothetical protein